MDNRFVITLKYFTRRLYAFKLFSCCLCDTHLDKIFSLEYCVDNLTYCLQTLTTFGTFMLAVYNLVSRFSCQIADLFDSWLSETHIRNCFEKLYLEVWDDNVLVIFKHYIGLYIVEVITHTFAFSCLLASASLSSSKVLSVVVTQSDLQCFHFVILVIQCCNLQLVYSILRHFS